MAVDDFTNLLERSKRFLLSAERDLNDKYVDIGIFSVNQSIDLFLKALLLKNAGDYSHSHDLKMQMRELASVLPSEVRSKVDSILARNSLILSVIQDSYITARYFYTSLSNEDLISIVETVKTIQSELLECC